MDDLREQYRDSAALQSVAEQLTYLIGIERGVITDLSKLKAINIGVIAAREIEDMDFAVARILQELDAEVGRISHI
ncbi:MAG: immunity protein Tsi6 family protein [Alphaproteobacteria bacterium]|nr:immunity protein Tsi6 family protein [Alphaproteobacteria bacterium]